MAEFVDNFSDLEELGIDIYEKHDPLTEAFAKAADHIQRIASKLDNETLLKQYGLYKQATEGPCVSPQPSWFDRRGRTKWDAWKKLGQMTQEEAKGLYIEGVKALDPNFDSEGSSEKGRVKVSSHERPKTPEVQTIVDHIRNSNVSAVAECLENSPHEVHKLDDEGLGLIHWAADSGNKSILEVLVRLGVDVNMTDVSGQTALHYAASCGHGECVEYLVETGCRVDVADEDGNLPAHVADDAVRELFQRLGL